MDSYERVHEYLQKLHLSTMDSIIDTYLESSHDRPVMDVLDHLLSEEVKNQKSRHVEARIRYSGLPFRKSLDDFDFTFQPSLDRKTIDDLMTLRFMHNMRMLSSQARREKNKSFGFPGTSGNILRHTRVLRIGGETCVDNEA